MYTTNTPAAELLALEHTRDALRHAETRRAALAVRRDASQHAEATTGPALPRRRRWWVLAPS